MTRGFYLGVPRLTPVVRRLLITLFVGFVVHLVAENWLHVPILATCALWIGPLRVSQLWQIFTHVFVQPLSPQSVISELIGLMFLWWILSPFEERYGGRRTLELCLVSLLGWALVPIAVGPFLRESSPLFGTSALAFGGFSAFAMTTRRTQVMLFGAVPVKAMHLLTIAIGYSVLLFLASRNLVVLLAGLGATASGAAYGWWLTLPPRKKKSGKVGQLVPFPMQRDARESKNPKHWLN